MYSALSGSMYMGTINRRAYHENYLFSLLSARSSVDKGNTKTLC